MAGAYLAASAPAAEEAYDTFVAAPLWIPLVGAAAIGATVFGTVAGLVHSPLVVAEEVGLASAAVTLLAGMTSLPERVRRSLDTFRGGRRRPIGRERTETCELVASAFRARGWAVEPAASLDAGGGGADLLLLRGREVLAVQVRVRGAAAASIGDVRRLEVATARHAADRGILVSVGPADMAARDYAAEAGIGIIDAEQLLPASPAIVLEPAPAPDCPECAAAMELRPSRFGSFWGCASFPSCRGSLPAGD